ncbi:MAG: hypothetical protein ACRCV9_14415 [Burkholderiaceae bacterium]
MNENPDQTSLRQQLRARQREAEKADRAAYIVIGATAYLMACLLGAMFLLGNRPESGAPLTNGQFVFMFFVVGPALAALYLFAEALLSGMRVLGWVVVIAVACAIAALGYWLL